MLSGSFTGHALNRSIAEKKGFAVVESMNRLDHLTAIDEISIFTDHSNLQYIFDPYRQKPGIIKQIADKLMRWASKLSTYRYVIEYLPAERNVWADMLIRWAVKPGDNALMHAPINIAEKEEYDSPTRTEIAKSQSALNEQFQQGFSERNGVVQNKTGLFWVPSQDEDLKHRLMITSHTGENPDEKQLTGALLLGWYG